MDDGWNRTFEYRSFWYAACPVCVGLYGDSEFLRVDSHGAWAGGIRGIVKPEVIVLGENVSEDTPKLMGLVEDCDQILIIGPTLALLSAQRLVRAVKVKAREWLLLREVI